MQRLGVLIELPRLLRVGGVDPEALLRKSDLDPSLFACAENVKKSHGMHKMSNTVLARSAIFTAISVPSPRLLLASE